MVSTPPLRTRFSAWVMASAWERPLSGFPDTVRPHSMRAAGAYPSTHSSSKSLTVRALVSLSPMTTTGLPQIPSLLIPHRTKPCTRGDRSKSPTKPSANSRRGSLPTTSKAPSLEAIAPRFRAIAKETAARVPTTEYVCRRSLSSELRPYPGYSPIKVRNPIHTATAKTPTTTAVCGAPRRSPPTNPRCSVARTPPARPAPPARRPTITRPGQPLVVSKPAPGGALAAAGAAMETPLPVEQYCRYWELDSSSTSSPPQPSMMVLILSHIQRQSANLPENQRGHHRFQTDRLSLSCSAVPLSIPLLTFGEATVSVSSYSRRASAHKLATFRLRNSQSASIASNRPLIHTLLAYRRSTLLYRNINRTDTLITSSVQ